MIFVDSHTEIAADRVFSLLEEKLQAIYRRPYLPQGSVERCLLMLYALLEVFYQACITSKPFSLHKLHTSRPDFARSQKQISLRLLSIPKTGLLAPHKLRSVHKNEQSVISDRKQSSFLDFLRSSF